MKNGKIPCFELACEQALQVDAREVGERRRKSEGPSRLALLAQIGEPARRLVLNSKMLPLACLAKKNHMEVIHPLVPRPNLIQCSLTKIPLPEEP